MPARGRVDRPDSLEHVPRTCQASHRPWLCSNRLYDKLGWLHSDGDTRTSPRKSFPINFKSIFPSFKIIECVIVTYHDKIDSGAGSRNILESFPFYVCLSLSKSFSKCSHNLCCRRDERQSLWVKDFGWSKRILSLGRRVCTCGKTFQPLLEFIGFLACLIGYANSRAFFMLMKNVFLRWPMFRKENWNLSNFVIQKNAVNVDNCSFF